MLLTASIWVVLVQELEQFMTFLATDFYFLATENLHKLKRVSPCKTSPMLQDEQPCCQEHLR